MPLVTLFLSPSAPPQLSTHETVRELEALLRTQFAAKKGVLQLNVLKTHAQVPWSDVYMSIRCKDLADRSTERLQGDILTPVRNFFEDKGVSKGAIRVEKFDEKIGTLVKWGEAKL